MPPSPSTTAPPWECVTATRCGWAASPFWHPQEERLYWVDREPARIWRLHLPSGHSELWELTQTPGSIAPCNSGGLLMALRDGIHLSASWHDIPQKIAAAPYDPARQCFDDGKCDPWGRFWVGTRVEDGEPADAALHCLHKRNRPSPELLRVAGGVSASSGLAWSPDGRILYWNDSARQRIDTYPMLHPGQYPPSIGTALTIARFAARPEDWNADSALSQDYAGRPQGAAVDRQGNYWVAMFEGARVLCLSPRGDVLASIPTPAQCPTALCFGGRDLGTLFLTTVRARRSPAELARHPDSGAVFARRMDIPGLRVNLYED